MKYKCNTTKTLEMTRVFLVEKEKAEREKQEVRAPGRGVLRPRLPCGTQGVSSWGLHGGCFIGALGEVFTGWAGGVFGTTWRAVFVMTSLSYEQWSMVKDGMIL